MIIAGTLTSRFKGAATYMATKTKLFGYWISSTDEDSAKEVVKMAGLPALVMGANAALASLVALFQTTPNLTIVAWSAIIALLLIILAFRIRAGRSAWLPLVLVLFSAFLVASAFSSYIVWTVAGKEPISAAQIITGWIVPLICMVLVVAGFKGWLWLRTNGAKRNF